MSPVTDILNKTIPSPAAAVVLSIGSAGTVAPWLSAAERAATQWLGVPSERLLEAQLILSLCILLVSAWVALFLVVRAHNRLVRAHAGEIHALKAAHADELAKKPVAAAQGAAQLTKRSRRDLLRQWDIDGPMF